MVKWLSGGVESSRREVVESGVGAVPRGAGGWGLGEGLEGGADFLGEAEGGGGLGEGLSQVLGEMFGGHGGLLKRGVKKRKPRALGRVEAFGGWVGMFWGCSARPLVVGGKKEVAPITHCPIRVVAGTEL